MVKWLSALTAPKFFEISRISSADEITEPSLTMLVKGVPDHSRISHVWNSGIQELQELQEFRSSGVAGVAGVQEFRSSGVQEFRSSGVQEFRSSGVQEFRSSGVQEFS